MDINVENSSLSKQISPLALSIALHIALIAALLSLNYLSHQHLSPFSHQEKNDEATVIFAPDQSPLAQTSPFFIPQGQQGGTYNPSLPTTNMPTVEATEPASTATPLDEAELPSETVPLQEPETPSVQTTATEPAEQPAETTKAPENAPVLSENFSAEERTTMYHEPTHQQAPLTLADIGKTFKRQLAMESAIAHAASGNGQEWHAGPKSSNTQLITDRTQQIALDRFMLKLGKAIENHFNLNKHSFPATTLINGTIRLGITFKKNGQIRDLFIIQSSGSADVDTHIMQMFKDASKRFPKLPDFLGEVWATQFSVHTDGYLKGASWHLNAA